MVKFTNIKMSYNRKLTINFTSFGFKASLKCIIEEGEQLPDAYKKIVENLSSITRLEADKVKFLMEQAVADVGFVGNKCEICGKDTLNKKYRLCVGCYQQGKGF